MLPHLSYAPSTISTVVSTTSPPSHEIGSCRDAVAAVGFRVVVVFVNYFGCEVVSSVIAGDVGHICAVLAVRYGVMQADVFVCHGA